MSVMESLYNKFRSSNDVEVTRAIITKEEFIAIEVELTRMSRSMHEAIQNLEKERHINKE